MTHLLITVFTLSSIDHLQIFCSHHCKIYVRSSYCLTTKDLPCSRISKNFIDHCLPFNSFSSGLAVAFDAFVSLLFSLSSMFSSWTVMWKTVIIQQLVMLIIAVPFCLHLNTVVYASVVFR